MLLMSTFLWIIIGVAVVILAVFIGTKIKDRYFQKAARGIEGKKLSEKKLMKSQAAQAMINCFESAYKARSWVVCQHLLAGSAVCIEQ